MTTCRPPRTRGWMQDGLPQLYLLYERCGYVHIYIYTYYMYTLIQPSLSRCLRGNNGMSRRSQKPEHVLCQCCTRSGFSSDSDQQTTRQRECCGKREGGWGVGGGFSKSNLGFPFSLQKAVGQCWEAHGPWGMQEVLALSKRQSR